MPQDLAYTAAFWKAADALARAPDKKCVQCGAREAAGGTREHPACIVRLVLRDRNPANLSPSNVAMGCARCFPVAKIPPSAKPSQMPQLFDGPKKEA